MGLNNKLIFLRIGPVRSLVRLSAVTLLALFSVGAGSAGSDPVSCNTRLSSVTSQQSKVPAKELGIGHGSPADEIALVLYCMTALADGQFRTTQNACGRAILLDPTDPAPYKLRGASYLFEGRFEQARLDFAQATHLDPQDPENHAGYAEALRGQNNFGGTIREFSAAIQLSPNNARLWNARCWTRGLFAKQLQQGLADCNTALHLHPRSANVLDSRGLIYLQLGQLANAVHDYDTALAIQHDLSTAYYGRGVARLRRGDLRGARADIAYARQIDPDVDIIFAYRPLIPYDCRPAMAGDSRSADWLCRKVKARQGPKKKPASADQSARLDHRDMRATVVLNFLVR